MTTIVAYDVADDRSRARLAALLSHHGIRLQRSVFEIDVPAEQVGELMDQIRGFLDLDVDVLHVIPQCAGCACGRVALGQAPPDLDARYYIV